MLHSQQKLSHPSTGHQGGPANQAVLESQCSHWILWISLGLAIATISGLTAQLAFNITDDDFSFITATTGPMQRFVIGSFILTLAFLLTSLTLGVVYLVSELPKRSN